VKDKFALQKRGRLNSGFEMNFFTQANFSTKFICQYYAFPPRYDTIQNERVVPQTESWLQNSLQIKPKTPK